MKKAIAAVLALMCVFGTGAVLPQFVQTTQSSVIAITASAADTVEIPVPGINASKYKYPYADTSVYTHTMTLVSKTDWTDDSSKNSYGIYEIVVKHKELQEDSKGNQKAVDVIDSTEYHIGLKTIKDTALDVTVNEKVSIPSVNDTDALNVFNEYLTKKVATEVAAEVKAAKAEGMSDAELEKLSDKLTKEKTEARTQYVNAGKVTLIADNAFKGSYLKTIDLTGVDYIGKNAFQNCQYIVEVTIPDTVRYVGDSAFSSSGLKTLNVNNDMPVIPASLCASTNLTDIKFAHPNYIRTISASAFKSTPLEAPVFQTWGEAKGYETLDVNDNAFDSCTSIKSIHLSDNINILGKNVFKGCTSAKDLIFGANTRGADQSCFEGCISLTDITFNKKLEALGGSAFAKCTSLQEVKGIPATVQNWVPYKSSVGWGFGSSMFSGCTNLKTVEYPPSVTVIPESTFSGCTALTSVYKGKAGKDGTAADETITLIDDNAFSGCIGIRYVSYPNATRLGNSVFRGCSSMETFKVGTCKGETLMVNNKETYFPGVGSNVLEGCSTLKEITLLSDSYSIYQHTSKQGDNNKGYTFKDCSSATKITISTDGMEKTPDGFFSGCTSLAEVKNSSDKAAFADITIVSPSTFEKCAKLLSVNLPKVRILETDAFMGCTVLESISADTNNKIKAENYGNNCFKDCPALGITVEGDIYTIGTSAFENSGVTKVNINGMAGGTVVIGGSAFAKCANLESATIMSGDAAKFSIGNTVFSDCPKLANAKYEGNLITQGMFKNCASLTKICTNATSIKANAFEGCESLTEVRNLDDTASIIALDIAGSAFKGCTQLITAPSDKNTAFDGTDQYNGCASLTSANVNALTKNMFANCSSLKTIKVDETVNAIPDGTFQNCTSLESFDLSKMQSVGQNAFAGSGLKSVKITDASSIGNNAFNSCSALESVDIAATKIGSNAFAKNVALKKATITADSIASNAFSGCTALTATGLSLKNTDTHQLTEISSAAFDGCTSLMGVLIPDTVSKIDTRAFGFEGSKKNADFVVGGEVDSVAEEYAKKNGFTFVTSSKFDANNLPKATDATDTTETKPIETKPTEPVTTLKKGDADGNGEIDILDVITINKAIMGKEILTDEQNKAADVDGSGKPDSNDSLQILKLIVGIITEL